MNSSEPISLSQAFFSVLNKTTGIKPAEESLINNALTSNHRLESKTRSLPPADDIQRYNTHSSSLKVNSTPKVAKNALKQLDSGKSRVTAKPVDNRRQRIQAAREQNEPNQRYRKPKTDSNFKCLKEAALQKQHPLLIKHLMPESGEKVFHDCETDPWHDGNRFDMFRICINCS